MLFRSLNPDRFPCHSTRLPYNIIKRLTSCLLPIGDPSPLELTIPHENPSLRGKPTRTSSTTTKQSKNLPASFECHSNLNLLPSSTQPLLHLSKSSPLQQSSTISNKSLKLKSPNLIKSEKPLPFSTITPLSFPPTYSIERSKVFYSIANQHRPPLMANNLLTIFHKFLSYY